VALHSCVCVCILCTFMHMYIYIFKHDTGQLWGLRNEPEPGTNSMVVEVSNLYLWHSFQSKNHVNPTGSRIPNFQKREINNVAYLNIFEYWLDVHVCGIPNFQKREINNVAYLNIFEYWLDVHVCGIPNFQKREINNVAYLNIFEYWLDVHVCVLPLVEGKGLPCICVNICIYILQCLFFSSQKQNGAGLWKYQICTFDILFSRKMWIPPGTESQNFHKPEIADVANWSIFEYWLDVHICVLPLVDSEEEGIALHSCEYLYLYSSMFIS